MFINSYYTSVQQLNLVGPGMGLMGVFDGDVRTTTRANAHAKDSQLPSFGALNLGAMTSLSALSETTGKSVSLIHGDQWDQIHGNYTENIFDDYRLTVHGNRTETVLQNHQHTIIGTTNTKHIGVHNHTNVAPRNDTFVHTRTEDHHQPEQKHQPTTQHDVQSSVLQYFEKHTKFSLWYFTMLGIKMEVVPGPALVYATFKGELGVLSAKAVVLKATTSTLDTKFQAFVAKTTATAVLLAAMYAKIIMFDGNAGIAANADSPFA